jgi:hypothetical protein
LENATTSQTSKLKIGRARNESGRGGDGYGYRMGKRIVHDRKERESGDCGVTLNGQHLASTAPCFANDWYPNLSVFDGDNCMRPLVSRDPSTSFDLEIPDVKTAV